MLSPENQKYGRAKSLKMAGMIIAVPHDAGTLASELTAMEGIGFEYHKGDKGSTLATQASGAARRRHTSTREAWSSVYGIDPDDANSFAPHRRKTIFIIDEESSETEEGDLHRGEF